ncbi:DUF2461 domain-containing protein [Nocardioides coralli]|uniref:DUF2461 domain-containing protein n=1 Tax=Nocardioides coralli TaxID=2872154 RepID=UPI001CA41624|nr:DUF2461 domain-containing protein [Nocardioides coralli]QZY28934.1 DUF2461 domain-containing protein [Nocardioides coralli]
MSFTGFPVAALDFYDDLEVDNSKAFWGEHKATYTEAVRAPMVALCEALGPEFGEAKVFRPYRDVRFAKDKTPYKTHQGAFIAVAPATGWYVEISARGTRAGAGCYGPSSPQLAAIRQAMAHDRTGPELERILHQLEADGFDIHGETVKTSPRGWSADHPRIDLLRRKQVLGMKHYGFETDAIGPDLLDRVRDDWRQLRPMVEWLAQHGRT